MVSRAAAPKGTMSCRTQGDFCLFVRVCVRACVRACPQALSGLKSALSGFKSVLSGLKSAFQRLKSTLSGLKSERADLRPERVNFSPERADFRPERAWGGRTNGRTIVPLCSTGHRPLRGRCPATLHSNSQSLKAGQRVSLTTYCPWATGFLSLVFGQRPRRDW